MTHTTTSNGKRDGSADEDETTDETTDDRKGTDDRPDTPGGTRTLLVAAGAAGLLVAATGTASAQGGGMGGMGGAGGSWGLFGGLWGFLWMGLLLAVPVAFAFWLFGGATRRREQTRPATGSARQPTRPPDHSGTAADG
ncbi:MAG: hypothetical protein V5A23_08630, partial [Halobacteriales archaeon]